MISTQKAMAGILFVYLCKLGFARSLRSLQSIEMHRKLLFPGW